MNLIITSDLHLHPYRICSRDGGRDRLLDGLSVLRQSLEAARARRAWWIMAGDFKVPKTHWPQDALTGALEVMGEYKDVPKLMIAGNHDARGIGGSGLMPFKPMAIIVEQPEIISLDASHRILCLPWDTPKESLGRVTAIPIVAHAFLAGVALGPDEIRLPGRGREITDYGAFPVAFFGDVHKGQWREQRPNRPPAWYPYTSGKVRPPSSWKGEVFYPGSPYQQNWGERHDWPKGVLYVNLDTGQVDLLPMKAPRFHQIEVDDAGLEQALAAKSFDAMTGDFVRVIYSGRGSMALGALQKRADEFRSLQVILRRVDKSEKRADIHAGMALKDLFSRYIEARPPENRDKALEAMLRLAGVTT